MKYSNRHISDDELDQLFRDAHASEGPEPLYVPEFWSEMEALLPAEQKKKRGFYWIPLAAAVILFSTLLFYPPNATEITKVNQHTNSEEGMTPDTDRPAQTTEQTAGQTTAQADVLTPAASDFQTGERTRTQFQAPRRITPNEDPAFQLVYIPPVPEMQEPTPTEEAIDEVIAASIPETEAAATADSDSFNLEPRNEAIIHDDVTGLPKKVQRESNQWYAELGPTLGQSPYISQTNKRNAVVGVVLGGGYTKRVDNTSVTLGLQARLEGFGGLTYRESNFSQNIARTVSVKQLYSLELPVKFGYHFQRSEFAFSVIPGVQLFVHGKETITQNQVVKREETYTGKVEHSNSLTMELGLQYYYNLSSKYSIGAKFNADILRPFHTDYYLGKLSGFPVNGQIVLRRTFTK